MHYGMCFPFYFKLNNVNAQDCHSCCHRGRFRLRFWISTILLLMGYGVTYLLVEGKQSTPITSGQTYGFRPAVLVDKPVHTNVSSNYPITPSACNFLEAHY
jgi:hypothetical protein